MQERPTIEVNRARPNHAIWGMGPMAVCVVAAKTLQLGMGNSVEGMWCIRDGVTGAHLRVWPKPWGLMEIAHLNAYGCEPVEPLMYCVAWIDGPHHIGSGRHLAEVMCGEAVGGRLELI